MFKVKERNITSVEPYEYLPVTEDEKYVLGEALVMSETVTKCGASERPTHICMGEVHGATVPVMPVLTTTRFEVPYTAKPAVGAVVTLADDAMQITDTAGGAFAVTGVSEVTKTAFGYFK